MLKNVEFLNQKMEMSRKSKVSHCNKDIWSLSFPFMLKIIHIHFNLVQTFEIEPKHRNVENVNRFKNEGFIFYWIFVVTGPNSCCCTKYAQLFLLDTQLPLILVG